MIYFLGVYLFDLSDGKTRIKKAAGWGGARLALGLVYGGLGWGWPCFEVEVRRA